jgi:DNA polymerase I-like protein with 3'-5' exonuclease and polymerase domains
MLSPVQPSNPGTHTLSRELSLTYTVGGEYVHPPLEAIVRGGWAAADIETAGLGLLGRDIKVLTLADRNHAVLLDVRDPAQHALAVWAFGRLDKIIFHNSPYDVPNLGMSGLWRPEWCSKVVDTLLYARLAEPSVIMKKSVEECAARYLGIAKSTTTMNRLFRELGLTIAEGWKRFDLDRPVYVFGAAMDAIVTARLEEPVRRAAMDTLTTGHPWTASPYGVRGYEAKRLVEREQILNQRIFLPRSVKGLRIDPEYADRYAADHRRAVEQATASLQAVGVTPGKAAELMAFLEKEGAIPEIYPTTPKTGSYSTAADNLKRLHHPVAEAYVTIKQIEHVSKDYLQKCLELEHEGRVHPQVNLLAAVTGRMSMGDPPLHQFPGDARGIILADEGDSLTSIDWSQVEPVLAANMAKDHDVLAGYEDGSRDFYSSIAIAAGLAGKDATPDDFKTVRDGGTGKYVKGRKTAKVILLAQLYGEGITKLALDLGVSIEEAKSLREVVFQPIPKVKRLVANMRSLAERHKQVFTMSGRILPIPSGIWGVDTHKGVNFLVQGSAYDTLAEALIRVDEAGLGSAVYLALHDELVVSTEAAEDVRKIMQEPPTRLIEIAQRTPVLRTDMLDLGNRWAEA